MLHKLGYLMLLVSLAIPASAARKPGSISGYVRNSAGVPQMGAAVDIFSSAASAVRVFTDDKGFYSVSQLLPGVYDVKVSAPSFLPAVRERLGLRSGASILVNVTLSSIFEAFQVSPKRGAAEDDDWKWTLRSASNRPVLRILPDGRQVWVASKDGDGDSGQLKGTVSFVAGSAGDGYGGSSDMSTGFSLERSMFSSGT